MLKVAFLLLLAAAPLAAQDRVVPYWASIAAGSAAMRTGPGREYPVSWLYHRRDLPVRVVQIHDAWRRVVEQDGTTGWMLAQLLSARRTAVVTGGMTDVQDLPDAESHLLWHVEAGVVGRILRCAGGWCRLQFGERRGYVTTTRLWGVAPGEIVQ